MNAERIKMTEDLEATLNKLYQKIRLKKEEFYEKRLLNKAKSIGTIEISILDALDKIEKGKVKLLKFVELSEKFRDSPEELIYLLSLPEIPALAGSGKLVAESIAGFRGLGIESIDHKIDEIKYENIRLDEGEQTLSEVSITNFMYRAPPFELTKCVYEKDIDKEMTDILGSRFLWLIKPKEVSWDSWDEILRKTVGGKKSILIKGKYTFEGDLVVPKTIELIDLSMRSITLEVGGRYQFFIKFGSSQIEKEAALFKTKEKFIQFLNEKVNILPKSIGHILASWKLRLDYPYFCYKGLGLSTDPFDAKCPFTDKCRLSQKRGGVCDGRLFWSGKYYKRRFYPKSYPLRRLKVGRGGIITYEDEFPLSLMRFTAYDMKRVESRWYAVEIGTWFINARPTIRIFFDSEIGYTIPTSVMEFEFNRELLNNIILEALKKESIRKSIIVKFILSKALGKTLDYKGLSKTVKELISQEGRIYEEYMGHFTNFSNNELVDFARRTLIHSLEHMLTQYILEKFAGVDMNFILTKYYYRYKSDRIVLAENAKNGKIGIVDTISRAIKEKGLHNFIYDFSNWLYQYLNNHANNFDRLVVLRKKEAGETITRTIERLERGSPEEQNKANKIRNICKKIEEFRKALDRLGIDLDITLARTVLLAGDMLAESDVEEIGDFFDDILERYEFKLCLDGCNGCVRLERYCGEGVQQILTTSRTLLYEFAEKLRDIILRGLTIRSNNLGEYVEPILFNVKKNLDIVCPYISPSYARRLIELSSKGVKIRVITWMPRKEDKEYEFQRETLRILKDNVSNNLLVKTGDISGIRLVHDKTYIIDNIVITGSFNLTESAFHGNLERAEIKLSQEAVKSEKEEFEKMWEKFADILSYNF
ncbi:MAG: phospholipase D family protein [Desulfurococcaceae archaeon]